MSDAEGRNSVREEMLAEFGLADLAELAAQRTPFPREALERVLAARNPLAAASLADRGRAAASGVEVTHPWTLRVRAPGIVHGMEDPTKVAHDLTAVAGIPATEMEMLGALPAEVPLALADEIVRSVASARPDLPLRALTSAEVERLAEREKLPRKDVLTVLKAAGLATLSWRPGCGRAATDVEVHRAAHAAGLRTVATIGTSHGRLDATFLDRLETWVRLAEESKGFLAATALPDRTDGASPLEGTSGTDDWAAFALVRLAFGNLVPRVTADWHVVGHKLGATLLSCGADDVVGAQAAAAWTAPTDDSPRPVNPDRARKWILEARRSPVLRDGLFRRVSAPPAAASGAGSGAAR